MRCSVVVPCRNEAANLDELHRRLNAVLPTLSDDHEILFVDDGSTDDSLGVMQRLAAADPHVRYVSFSRNFGHEAASTAGLDRADGDCVILMDADLQDPPERIPDLVAKWREGYEEVHATRRHRLGLNPLRRALTWLFYRAVTALSEIPLPLDTGNFRLMDRRVVESFRRCRERGRYVSGLITWVGFRQGQIEYDRPARLAGRSNYGFRQLVRLALDAVSGFSVHPLRIASVLGLVVTVLSFGAGLAVVIHKLFLGLAIPGYALATSGLFFLGGVQLLFLGIIGEYLGRVYRQVQDRPLYIVREEGGAGEDSPAAAPHEHGPARPHGNRA
jgi:glycosyltransferase involved in cell wall biosynthesis